MGKKNKDDAPNPNSVPNRDIIQRLNFLYQASTYLNGIGAAHSGVSRNPSPTTPTTSKDRNDIAAEQNGSVESVEKEVETTEVDKKEDLKSVNTRKRPGRRKASTRDLACSYVKSMKIIGQKTNVKM